MLRLSMKPHHSAIALLCGAITLNMVLAQPGVHQMLGMALPTTESATGAAVLNPACIPKYYDTLVLPPVMPQSSQGASDVGCDPPNGGKPGDRANWGCSARSNGGQHGRRLMHGQQEREGETQAFKAQDNDSKCNCKNNRKSDLYWISAREITQHVLPPVLATGVPSDCTGYTPNTTTRVYGYGTTTQDGRSTHNWPGFTIEARTDRPVKVTWVNELLDLTTKQYKQHLLKNSIDQTLHWANPAGIGSEGIDSSPCMPCAMDGTCTNDASCNSAANRAGAYEGPVPLVAHLHGNEKAYDFSDGYPEAWFMPAASNLAGYSPVGTWYNTFKNRSRDELCDKWADGSAIFTYKNQQNPTQLWYHDHVLGITRLNVYAGLAGLYHLRDVDITKRPELPGLPYPPPGIGFPDSAVRELPLAIQDRVFDVNSQLYYPVNNLPNNQVLPEGPVPSKWIPEFLGITLDGTPLDQNGTSAAMMVVNGKTWPTFSVAREPYRLRLLNGCNARTLVVYFSTAQPTPDQIIVSQRLNFYVIGNEAGFFPSIVGPVQSLLLGPAERYDVIIDFSQLPSSESTIYMLNEGPEVPYNGSNNGELLTAHTAQVMRFDLQSNNTGKTFAKDVQPKLEPALKAKYQPVNLQPPPKQTRKFTLIENGDANGNVVALYLGQAETVNGVNRAIPKTWSDSVTTNADVNSVEEWELINLTVDAHPIHIHEVYFQVVSIRNINVSTVNDSLTWVDTGVNAGPAVNKEGILSAPCNRPPGQTCILQKDTILVPPGTVTTVRLKTGSGKGLFPWHCHLLEHEDNEMMRPWCIGNVTYINPKTNEKMCPGPPGVPPL